MSKPKINILITNLSLMQTLGTVDECTYDCSAINELKNVSVNGIQTNEAGTKTCINYLRNGNDKLHEIIYLYTKEVDGKSEKNDDQRVVVATVENDKKRPLIGIHKNKNNKDVNFITITNDTSNVYMTAREFYEYRIKEFYDEASFTKINIKGKMIPESLINKINKIEQICCEYTPVVYIDTTGAHRDASDLLQMLVKFLTYKGIEIKLAFYSDWRNKRDMNYVYTTDTYDLLKILDGVNQFVTSGQCKILKEAFAGINNKKTQDLLNEMENFADAMQICQIYNLNRILKKMNGFLCVIEKDDNFGEDDNRLLIFKQFLTIVRDKFFGNDKSHEIDTVRIIEWAIENNLVQQALTVFTEKISEYLYKNNIITLSDEDAENNRKNQKTDDAYTLLIYENLLYLVDEMEEVAKTISNNYGLIKNHNNKDWVKDIVSKIGKDNFVTAKLSENKDKLLRYFRDRYNIKNTFLQDPFKQANAIRKIFEFPEKDDDMIKNKLITINNLDLWVNKYNKVILNKNLSIENAQVILVGFLYAKAIRNQINHASENENIDTIHAKGFKDYEGKYVKGFDNYGYSETQTVKASVIMKNIKKALDVIKDVREKENENTMGIEA